MRAYVILGLSIMFFLLGLDTLLEKAYKTILDDIFDIVPVSQSKSVLLRILGTIFIITSMLGFFYLWKNNAFKKNETN